MVAVTYLIALPVVAQPYPAKAIRIIVGFAPGGAVDMVARITAQRLSDSLGRPAVVENRPGASTNIAAELVARAAPDGYTLLMGSSSNATNMTLFRNLPYDTLRDFAPVTQVGYGPQVLAMHPSLPAKSVKELLALAKAMPGQLSYASAGNGSSQHLTGELFKLVNKVDIVHVPYKGGQPALVDVISGQVAFMFINTLEVLPHARSGRLKVLAVASARRSSVLPDAPTFAESGLPGFEAVTWWGLLAPAGTPREIIARLHGEVVKGLATAEMKERLTGLGAEAVGNTPEQFGAFLREEVQKWGNVVRTVGIKVD
jgi:tripartite-type tricarboxylate transporter receptor subunit TctC